MLTDLLRHAYKSTGGLTLDALVAACSEAGVTVARSTLHDMLNGRAAMRHDVAEVVMRSAGPGAVAHAAACIAGGAYRPPDEGGGGCIRGSLMKLGASLGLLNGEAVAALEDDHVNPAEQRRLLDAVDATGDRLAAVRRAVLGVARA